MRPTFPELIRTRAFRRAIAFTIGVGVPAVAGLWLQESAGLLVGVITAMMFSFADDEGPLVSRFTALSRTALGIGMGASVGHLLGHYGVAFWLLFVVTTFGAGWLNRAGKTAHIGARLTVMALTVAAGNPEMSRAEVEFVGGALLVVVLVRLADHAIFGPLPASSLPPPPPALESERFWLRYTTAYTGAATVALWLGLMLDPQHAIWVVITTLVVMQPDVAANYRRILERVIGTVVGVVAAYALTRVFASGPALIVALIVTAAFLPHHIPVRYWVHTAAIALLVMLTYDLASQAGASIPAIQAGLFEERLIDVFVGCMMALVGTEIGFRWGEHLKKVSDAKPGVTPAGQGRS